MLPRTPPAPTPRPGTLGAGRLAAALLCATMATAHAQPAPDAGAPPWAGTYIGHAPAPPPAPPIADARMVLVLGADGRYQLMHDGRSKGAVYASQTSGRFSWTDGQTTLRLGPDGPVFRVGDGFVERLPDDGTATPVRLQRQQRFVGPDGELLIDPASLRSGPLPPGDVRFSAIWNLPAPTPQGQRSLSARFALDCATRRYRLTGAEAFSQPYLRGQPVASALTDAPRPVQGTLLAAVAQRHCPR